MRIVYTVYRKYTVHPGKSEVSAVLLVFADVDVELLLADVDALEGADRVCPGNSNTTSQTNANYCCM